VQLLRTARELFLRDGYLATSLDKVADAAGFSKGAVYSNFRNKDELCLAVLDELRAERAAEITGLLGAPTTAERLRRFEEWAQRVIGDPQWTTLEFEFAVQARRSPELRQAMADRLAAVTRVVESAVATLTDAPTPTDANAREVEDRGDAPDHGDIRDRGGVRDRGNGVRVGPMATDQAAVALLCLGVGLGLFRSIDPDMPVGALVDTVRVLAGLPAER
jgi:AcrR family transcriptional regulator